MPQSYFALFNLEPRFALPGEQLDRAYRTLATRVHPDRYARATPSEQRQALELATNANEAYRTLKKPVLRAQHLLSLRGIETVARSATIPAALLLEQMEWREALSDAQATHDGNALQRLDTTVRGRAAALLARLETQLDAEKDNPAAAQSVQQLMFVEKLIADIDEARALLEA